MDIDVVQAQWVLDLFPADQLPEFAAQAMMQGHDGPHILELASFHRPTRWDIKPELFDAALREMGRAPLRRASAALRLGRAVALRILRAQISPDKVAGEALHLRLRCAPEDGPAELLDLENRLVAFEDDLGVSPRRNQAIVEWAWELLEREPSP